MKRRIMVLGNTILLSLILSSCFGNTKVANVNSNNIYNNQDIEGEITSNTIFIGGKFDGEEYIGQSRVTRLGIENSEKSIVMIPGHGLSSYIYTSTPDNRTGWTSDFAKYGYDTYAIDTNNLVISGLEIKDFGTDKQPELSTWSINKMWKTWGFGEEVGKPYDTTQYPVKQIEQLYASFSPMIKYSDDKFDEQKNNNSDENLSKKSSSRIDILEVNNTIELLEKQGASVLLVHSMGAMTGFEVVRQRPELVEALVVIEPVGSPTNENDVIEHFNQVPYLAIYGDFIESRGQTSRYESCKETVRILNDNNGIGEVITLTEWGMQGNTHLMMQDKNSSEVSKIIVNWIEDNVY